MNELRVWLLVGLGWLVTVPLGTGHLRRAGGVPSRQLFLIRLISCGWLAGSAAFATAAATGMAVRQFSDDIVLLTAAHFVTAGFGLGVLVFVTAGARAFLVQQAGMVLVALGITGVPKAEPIGAALLVASLVWFAFTAWTRHVGRLKGWRRVLLTISSVAWMYPMFLALSWALATIRLGIVGRTLDEMVAQHGLVNAVAVVIFGLAALPTIRTMPPPTSGDGHTDPPAAGATQGDHRHAFAS